MTGRKRWWVIGLASLGVLVVAEVAFNLARGPEACVEVQNAGAEPIEGLTLTLGSSQASVARVEPGGTARLYLRGRRAQTLVMKFLQRGNALGAFEQPGFNPSQMSRDGFKQVLRVRINEVERYQDDSDPSTPVGRLIQAFWKAIEDPSEADDVP
jgi:hypothetical protein